MVNPLNSSPHFVPGLVRDVVRLRSCRPGRDHARGRAPSRQAPPPKSRMTMRSFLQRLSRPDGASLLLGLMCSLPFVLPLGTSPIPSFEAEWVAALLGLAAWGAALASRRGSGGLSVPAIVLLPAGLCGLVVIQVATGRVADPHLATLACLYFAWAGLMACLGARIRAGLDAGRCIATVATALLAGAMLNAAAATAQAFSWADGLQGWILPVTGARPGGNLGQPNHLATHLALGVASLAYLRVTRRMSGTLAFSAAALLAAGLSWTGSRMAWLLVLALLSGGVLLGRRAGVENGRTLRRLLLVFACLFVLVELAGQVVRPPEARYSALGRMTAASSSTEERVALWRGALRILAQSPLTGSGQGTFAERFLQTAPELPGPVPSTMSTHAHSLPLEIGVEFGAVGLVLSGVSAWLWWRGVRRGRMTPETGWAIAVVWIVGVHSLVEYPLWYTYFLGPAALALGLAEGPRLELTLGRPARLARAGGVLAGVVVLASLASDYAFLRAFGDGSGTSHGRVRRATIERLADMQRVSLLSAYAGVGLLRGMDVGPRGLSAKVALSSAVVRVFPLPDVTYRHALLLAASGDAAGAHLWWRRARACYPAQAPLWLAVARRAALSNPDPALVGGSPTGDNS
ncbi:MAG: hypothetical protein GC151_05860 [Betaproteobacteria bacterium]|nr:hypothetical protein [Betaproteobacteria bacterium]